MLAFLLLSLQLALCSAECSEYIDIYDRYICISFLMPWDMVCGADGEYSNDFYKLYHLMGKGGFQKFLLSKLVD